MSTRVRPNFHVNVLRALVGEPTGAAARSVSLARLLQVLDLEERLVDIGLRIDDARSALVRGDLATVEVQLASMESQLRHFVDLP